MAIMNDELTGRVLANLQAAVGGMPVPGGPVGSVLPSASAPAPTFTPPAGIPGGGDLPTGNPGGDLASTRPDLAAVIPLLRAGVQAQARTPGFNPAASMPPAGAQAGAGGILQRLLSVLPQAIQVGASNDPGAALGQLIQMNMQAQQRRQEMELADQQRQAAENRAMERDLTMAAVQEDINSRREDVATGRQDRRDEAIARRERARDEALLNRQDAQQRAAEDRQDKRLSAESQQNEAKAKQQQLQKARDLASQYRKLGAGKYAKELADYDAGLTETLSKEAAGWESAQVKLAEMRAARVGAAGAGAGKPGDIPVAIYDDKGQFVRQATLNGLGVDPVSGQTKLGAGYTYKIIPQTQGAAAPTMTLEQKIEAAQAKGIAPAQIIQAIRAEDPKRADELIRQYKLAGASAAESGAYNPATGRTPLNAFGRAVENIQNVEPIRPAAQAQRYGGK